MMMKWISMSLLGGGLIAAAVFGIVWTNGKETIARAAVAKAEADEAAALAAERKSRNDADAAAKRAAAKESEAKTAEERRKAQEAAAEEAKAAAQKAEADKVRATEERAKAADDRARAEAESEKAVAERATALAAKETAKLEAAKAKSLAEAEAMTAQAAADALAKEKLASEKVIAEAKLYEMRQLDLANMERELLDYKRELDEREMALRPEKTIKDLENIGEDDESKAVADGVLLPENDRKLPASSRALAKATRIADEELASIMDKTRTNVVSRLEGLYVEAVKEDRIVDADFYRKELKRMYPDWKYSPQKNEKEEDKK